ncbi:uncharacterized protein LOC118752258 [Rhagoletis pomonella]|uniref:uncharacterized protein LOC118752258 n=1 Tax=Rhagoletis pomonella TaxID=28610 RepID=UPI001781149C|nr:uncharacterized protein LOC118752258 [Rhagoletis pomonella]XP_036343010.1 uncharacterized protein LOC118752258 [Rhagoletis pomonella]
MHSIAFHVVAEEEKNRLITEAADRRKLRDAMNNSETPQSLSKKINRHQIEILITLMEARPDIARGFHKGHNDEVSRFWRNAEAELNSAGPPLKNITQWKKVWTDQKKYVRHKAAQSFEARKSSGGGPNTQQKLSPNEEAIYKLIGMNENVERISASIFGLSPSSVSKVVTEEPERDEPDNIEYSERTKIEICESQISSPVTVDERTPSPPPVYVAPEKKLKFQKGLLETVTKAVNSSVEHHEEQKRHFREMERLKREEIAEMRRHNNLLEQLLKM